jgi:hypothetical protein
LFIQILPFDEKIFASAASLPDPHIKIYLLFDDVETCALSLEFAALQRITNFSSHQLDALFEISELQLGGNQRLRIFSFVIQL